MNNIWTGNNSNQNQNNTSSAGNPYGSSSASPHGSSGNPYGSRNPNAGGSGNSYGNSSRNPYTSGGNPYTSGGNPYGSGSRNTGSNNNKKRRNRNHLWAIILALVIGLLIGILLPFLIGGEGFRNKLFGKGGSSQNETENRNEAETKVGAATEAQTETEEGPGLTVRVFDVGEGLAIMLESQGEYMLFDGGGRNTSSRYINDLRDTGMDKVKYVMASHFDEDHIAGLVGAMNNYEVEHVIAPSYEAETAIYQSFMRTVAEKSLTIETPKRGSEFALGSCKITCLSTPDELHEEENDYSLVLRVVCGDSSILLTGDATWVTEQDILHAGMNVKSDILVVGHHGSSSSSDREFLQAVDPDTAVISVGENDYGHPTQAVLDRLQEQNIQLLRTDLQGNLKMRTDGSKWEFDPMPGNEYSQQASPTRAGMIPVPEAEAQSEPESKAGSENESQTERKVSEGTTYVLNRNTRKFHYPDCASVQQIKDKNYGETTENREQLIAEGYEPCGSCNP